MSATILVPVDGSAASAKAIELLAGFGGDRTALAVCLLNVQEPPAPLSPELGVEFGRIEAALRQSGEEIIARAQVPLQAAGFQTEASVHLGFPAATIVQEAEAKSAALIVMGTRGHGVLHGFALGSVAMRVAHASRVPVWLVHPECSLPKAFGRSLRVLLAIDGTAPGVRAARRLVAWRRWLGELDVQVAFVQRPLGFLATILPPHDDVQQEWSTRAAETATQAARQVLSKARIPQHLHITYGDPAEEIAHLAAHTGAELVALGTRGLGAAHHALIGSVALKSAVTARVPVMLVR
jgi:nucleotide-binding universal stress UspA family protein